jgi:hypothetical protein
LFLIHTSRGTEELSKQGKRDDDDDDEKNALSPVSLLWHHANSGSVHNEEMVPVFIVNSSIEYYEC